ncbi:MAG: ribosomal large subunit pseudouridine synthase B [Clostridia bacterium]|nr:ribosomal large subunit pseudouridine synthase B [Clostridia bacterium]
MKYSTTTYTTTEINRNFRIKVAGIDGNGNRINTLVGVSRLIKLIGEDLFNKFVKRAFDCMLDVCVCKLRRGLKVSFYNK